MTTTDRRTRETVSAAIALSKKHSAHGWEDVADFRFGRWTTLTSPPKERRYPAEINEDLQDAVDAILAKQEAEEHGTVPLAAIKKELDLGD